MTYKDVHSSVSKDIWGIETPLSGRRATDAISGGASIMMMMMMKNIMITTHLINQANGR